MKTPAVALHFAMLFVLGCSNDIPSRQTPPALSPAQVAEKLRVIDKAVSNFASSISTLEGKFEYRIIPAANYPETSDSVTFEDRQYVVSFLADVVHGWQRLDTTSSWLFPWYSTDQRFVYREVDYNDGNKAATLIHHFVESPVESEIPAGAPMFLNMQPVRTDSVFGPWRYSGLQIHISSGPGLGLASLFQANAVTLDGEEVIDGVSCVRIVARDYGQIFWLDPEHDYLPRKQVFGLETGDNERVIFVHKFGRFDDGAGNKIWFPTSGVAELGIVNYTYELKELTLNPPCTREQFMIDPKSLPPGVLVREIGGKDWVVGDRRDLFDKMECLRARRAEMIEERLKKSKVTGENN